MADLDTLYEKYEEQNNSKPSATQFIKFCKSQGTPVKYSDASKFLKSRSSIISQSVTKRSSITQTAALLTKTESKEDTSQQQKPSTINENESQIQSSSIKTETKTQTNTKTETQSNNNNSKIKKLDNSWINRNNNSPGMKPSWAKSPVKPLPIANDLNKPKEEQNISNNNDDVTKFKVLAFDGSSIKKNEPKKIEFKTPEIKKDEIKEESPKNEEISKPETPKKEVKFEITKNEEKFEEKKEDNNNNNEKKEDLKSRLTRTRTRSHVKANSIGDASELPQNKKIHNRSKTNDVTKKKKNDSKKKQKNKNGKSLGAMISHKKQSSWTDVDKKSRSNAVKKSVNQQIRDVGNTAQLMYDPKKRKEMKKLMNKSAGGFDLHVNRRYKLIDGRIGICLFKGRTLFGKSNEDWIGIKLEVGDGKHDGTVKGKQYFRCRKDKGIMVRPYKIEKDLGSKTKQLTQDMINKAKIEIEQYKKVEQQEKQQSQKKTSSKKKSNNIEEEEEWTPYEDYEEDHGTGFLDKKLIHSKTLFDKNKDKKAKKKKFHYEI